MQEKTGNFGFWGSDFGNAWCMGKSRGVDISCIPGNSPCFQLLPQTLEAGFPADCYKGMEKNMANSI